LPLFAERGFQGASVRSICSRAGVNLAAANYYFGSKRQLYREVLRFAVLELIPPCPGNVKLGGAAPPKKRLRFFIQRLLTALLENQGTLERLFIQELVRPMDVKASNIPEELKDRIGILWKLVGEILGPGAHEATVDQCAASVFAQCLFQAQCERSLSRATPITAAESDQLARIVTHITRFNIAALEGLRSHR
jgi:TetR/AcrR family transcriptional regulator, regulator of cefoperazone and chloramphenicol sensitivity